MLLGWILVGATLTCAQAGTFQLEILLSEDAPAYHELANTLQAELGIACARSCTNTPNVRVTVVDDWRADAPRDLLVTLGNGAALQAARLRAPAVLYGLIPESTWQVLRRLRGHPGGTASAVFIDQPLARQFRLLDLALPEKRRIGVLLGPESARHEGALQDLARSHGITLQVMHVTTPSQVGPAIRMLSEQIDALLAVPDPLVFNRDTLYGILLTSYNAGVPVVGYSEALVTAGAMLGIYTSVADMGRQLALYSADYIIRPEALPPAGPSRYFEIAINHNVARSLGFQLPEAATLRQLLDETGGSDETAQTAK